MTTILILLAISFLFWGVVALIGKNCYSKLEKALIEGNHEQFEDIYFSFVRRLSLSSTKVMYLVLNYALSKDDSKTMDELYDQMAQFYLSKANKRKVYPVMFQYYLEKEDRTKCKELLKAMNRILDEAEIANMEMIYEINVEKSSRYISELLEQSASAEGQEKGMMFYLIARQYGNRHEEGNRKKYLQEAFEYLKDTPFGQVVSFEMKH
ncbi:MAG: hypothetical protein ACI32F_03790 [Allobaculum sp.]